jgi:type VI secretion system protein ImpH
LISFFYRAWEKYRFPIAYERSRRDPFTAYLFDLIGLGTKGLSGRMRLPDQGLLLYAGLIAQKPHSAAGSRRSWGTTSPSRRGSNNSRRSG